MGKIDPQIVAHLEWISFVRPTGLVVSAPALVRAGAILDRRDAEGQRLLRACTADRVFDPKKGPQPWLPDFRAFAASVLGWSFSPKGYAGTAENPIPIELEMAVTGYEETLRPDYGVRELDQQSGSPAWQLLVRVLEPDEDFDRVVRRGGGLEASAHGRMERLLRQTGVSAGLLFNGRTIRLVSAPGGESSGWLDFHVADMIQTAGRPISTALRLLLSEQRLLAMPRQQRFAALLADSRKFQNEVSERLAEQVLHALYEVLRGFQAAHDASKGELLRGPLGEHPDEVYRALLTVILRLVFLLYAEERDVLPEDEAFLRYYSIAGLHERLREDAALYPDTMDQRFGAWAQLLVLFRMVHDGAESGPMRLPRRHGVLFDPDRFPFLEGRPAAGGRQLHERIEPPLVPDGTIYRALEKLLVLDGERISYRALDVEEIGSVYQAMMGFRLETATGRSVAVKAQKKWSAPTNVNLEALLEVKPAERKKWLEEQTDRRFTETAVGPVKEAGTVDDLHAALSPVVDREATPDLVPQGAMVLQPSEERRRSGSHYTPRTLTEPIVQTTLQPILTRLRGPGGQAPRPEQILDVKVCDPAMGSGAFLVEACRQLGDALVEGWRAHGGVPVLPPDEDELIYARRIVAQRCLYGVDRNPVAVDLAKVSLWLATLAKDHPLTFVDHVLRHGDSLVGLSREQIEAFHWDAGAPRFQAGIETLRIREHLAKVSELRAKIRNAGEDVSDWALRYMWDEAQAETSAARLLGDLAVAAFFDGKNKKEREAKRAEYAKVVLVGKAGEHRAEIDERRYAEPPLVPFHWPLEFPEVFEREQPGFDAVVGNPPFLGGRKISGFLGGPYLEWLTTQVPEAGGQADLVAYFFRRVFCLLNSTGTMGLLATNTISQGDTRKAALGPICVDLGGHIYAARRRVKWPGTAAVVLSSVHIAHQPVLPVILDDEPVSQITSYLVQRGGSAEPKRLIGSHGIGFKGQEPYGRGFIFSDGDEGTNPLALADRLLRDPHNREVIQVLVGGEELLSGPLLRVHRKIINFGDMSEAEARRWPELFAICEKLVKRERANKAQEVANWPFWRFWRTRSEFRRAAAGLQRVMMHPFTSTYSVFLFMPASWVLSSPHAVFASQSNGLFAICQSRIHENWAVFFGSSLKDDLRYTISDCFETFPLPEDVESLRSCGEAYYRFRERAVVDAQRSYTALYRRFHEPDERDAGILKLRELHAEMDGAVLDAYGWNDIKTHCEFFLDYEIDEEEWGDKKKPWRYRWPDEVREEVLARLLELNAERGKDEARAGSGGPTAESVTKPSKGGFGAKKDSKRKPKDSKTGDLF